LTSIILIFSLFDVKIFDKMRVQKHNTFICNILIKLKYTLTNFLFMKLEGPLTTQAFFLKHNFVFRKNKEVQIICHYKNYSLLATLFIISINTVTG